MKIVPSSSRDAIAGWLGDALKVRVIAPPERGKANLAVERIIARALAISTKSVRIVSGKTSQRKGVRIEGLSQQEVDRRLGR